MKLLLKQWCPSYTCTTIHRHPIFSTRYSVMCKVYTGYHGTSGIEHGLSTCTVDNPLTKAWGLSLRTGAQTMLSLSPPPTLPPPPPKWLYNFAISNTGANLLDHIITNTVKSLNRLSAKQNLQQTTLKFFYFHFSKKMRLEVSCESFA